MNREAAVLALCLSHCLHADVVLLNDGDRTGVVLKKDGNTVSIKTDSFGVVNTSWDRIASLTTEQPVHVSHRDGRAFQGPLTVEQGEVQVAGERLGRTDVEPVRDANEQSRHERLLNPGWLNLRNSAATLGWAGSRGNADTGSFTLAIDSHRTTVKDKATVRLNVIRATVRRDGVTADTARAIRGGSRGTGLRPTGRHDFTLRPAQRLQNTQGFRFFAPLPRTTGSTPLTSGLPGRDERFRRLT